MNRKLQEIVTEHPYRRLFITVSGAHLYGFPSPDSDWDLRGAHILPFEKFAGLDPSDETVERSFVRDGMEVDFVTHDLAKFFRLVLKKNGYVLEQIYSPLVVETSPEHEELKQIAKSAVTKHHTYHYLGFAANEWKLFENTRSYKRLLYVYRVLLTGIYLMHTGEIEANLTHLLDGRDMKFVHDLIEMKKTGAEKGTVPDIDITFHRSWFTRLEDEMKLASEKTHLPEAPTCRPMLDDLLLRLRQGS